VEDDPARRRALDALPRLNELDRQVAALGQQILDADQETRTGLEAQLLALKAERSELMKEAGITEFVADSATVDNTGPVKINTYRAEPPSSN
jgi:hypothetical protein